MAPEVANQELLSNEKSDIWSFGMTLIELADCEMPCLERFEFCDKKSDGEMLQCVAQSSIVPTFKNNFYSEGLRNILSNAMLIRNPEHRFNAVQTSAVSVVTWI